jgi:hypothetical protein
MTGLFGGSQPSWPHFQARPFVKATGVDPAVFLSPAALKAPPINDREERFLQRRSAATALHSNADVELNQCGLPCPIGPATVDLGIPQYGSMALSLVTG